MEFRIYWLDDPSLQIFSLLHGTCATDGVLLAAADLVFSSQRFRENPFPSFLAPSVEQPRSLDPFDEAAWNPQISCYQSSPGALLPQQLLPLLCSTPCSPTDPELHCDLLEAHLLPENSISLHSSPPSTEGKITESHKKIGQKIT